MKAEVKVEKISLGNGKVVLRISGRNIPLDLKNEIIREFGIGAELVEVNTECNSDFQI